MRCPDLTPYSHWLPRPMPNVAAVGWLGDDAFPTGPVNGKITRRLIDLYCEPPTSSFDLKVNRIRGFHPCEICNETPTVTSSSGRTARLGMAELWIPNSFGGWYACPSMIIHYIQDHSYKPPSVFIEAVGGLNDQCVMLPQEEFYEFEARDGTTST